MKKVKMREIDFDEPVTYNVKKFNRLNPPTKVTEEFYKLLSKPTRTKNYYLFGPKFPFKTYEQGPYFSTKYNCVGILDVSNLNMFNQRWPFNNSLAKYDPNPLLKKNGFSWNSDEILKHYKRNVYDGVLFMGDGFKDDIVLIHRTKGIIDSIIIGNRDYLIKPEKAEPKKDFYYVGSKVRR